MLMIIKILFRLLKSGTRVLLVGWTPKPPSDFEDRLHKVEQTCWRLEKRQQRAGAAGEQDQLVLNPPSTEQIQEPDNGMPALPFGVPPGVRHGDSYWRFPNT